MKKILLASLIILDALFCVSQNENAIHHVLDVRINPNEAYISVTDSITNLGSGEIELSLNAALSPVSFSKNVIVEKIEKNLGASDVGMDREDSDDDNNRITLNKWKLRLKKGSGSIIIQYKGNISSPFSQSEEDYARGFSETPGIISDSGIYLAGSTHWVPAFEDKLVTFKLNTTLPEGWKTVSQGTRLDETKINDHHQDTWLCETPQEEVFLIAARFHEYTHHMNSGVEAMAFLRTPDEGLANKYLDLTEQYMDMYQNMIGSYPYTKFALVENFWETGYGMPSFTLLGEKIIRFPFILYSSYPHELLHNWWGNSVYVDFSTGNWCEGLTAYGADHLISEQRGQGEEYRRSTLQKFANVVDPTNDFPLNKFISRQDAASEAIGYGKSMMMWHMLRRKLGDENFIKGMSLFYQNNKFKKASFDDMRLSMETVSGMDLKPFFTQWLTRTGAPEIELNDVNVSGRNDQFQVSFTLDQVQSEPVFDVDVPVTFATKKGLESFVVSMSAKSQDFKVDLVSEPLKMVIDPQYDVFRILDPLEVPPTWSKILASKKNLFVLPSLADKEKKQLYVNFTDQWKAADIDDFEVLFDDEISSLPNDRTCWILGFENKFATKISTAISDYQATITGDTVKIDNTTTAKKNHSFILTTFNNNVNEYNLAFIAIDNEKAIEGLIRKLPHYGKYSYLGFDGEEPVNVLKGQWPVLNSPLVKIFDKQAQKINMIQKRDPLANMAPVFSEQKMMESVKYLASDELVGRGLGTPELDSAAAYIANKFKKYGLLPMGNSYFQQFSHTFPDKGELQMKNVVAVIPGTDAKLKDSPVVISAHYDHLGLGWPDVHKGDEGKIHNGADDNASGVAILLEVARTMAKSAQPKRTIIFAAFTAEEAGLIGSRYFVSKLKNYFSGNVIADINLDTDGSLFDKKLIVLNANSAREWKFVFMGTDYTTGVKSELVMQELDASDQVAFIEKGIPAIQLFTGATENYHRPTDTYDKIDGKGLVKVATVAKEVVAYMADRDEPFGFTGKVPTSNNAGNAKPKTVRRASTGSIPDFSYSGEGVKIGSVMEDSPGEKAGLMAGDVITALNGEKLANLMDYSNALKKHQPGDVVELKILRNGEEKTISITLGER